MSYELNEKELDYYQKLRRRMQRWLSDPEHKQNRYAEYIMAAPDIFHLLVKLTLDPNVPITSKYKLGLAIAYFMSPIDIIPEIILGPVGFVDDIAVAAYVLNAVMKEVNPAIIEKHWAGDHEILPLITQIIEKADSMLGGGAWKRLQNFLKRKNLNGHADADAG
ncbi:MAG: DUF1232 domain-containing protein [Candidatus Marinimicrobia bacterium]|nr:DUF1232 domain-containing protein [Candidatus Neomarinimicrobiota bacterium]MCF7839711.1 DUF1232 domain-containing protein [Candidatus Neomarinimicrobiota bacterium]